MVMVFLALPLRESATERDHRKSELSAAPAPNPPVRPNLGVAGNFCIGTARGDAAAETRLGPMGHFPAP